MVWFIPFCTGLQRNPSSRGKGAQCCIDTTSAISIHKWLRVAAHFSSVKEVNELTKFAQISLITGANWCFSLYVARPVSGRIIYSFALKADYTSVRLLVTTSEAALAHKEDKLSAKQKVSGLMPGLVVCIQVSWTPRCLWSHWFVTESVWCKMH